MHSSGSITRKFGPSWKQSTGQTSTQSMYLHLMQFSVTTNAMIQTLAKDGLAADGANSITAPRPAPASGQGRPRSVQA